MEETGLEPCSLLSASSSEPVRPLLDRAAPAAQPPHAGGAQNRWAAEGLRGCSLGAHHGSVGAGKPAGQILAMSPHPRLCDLGGAVRAGEIAEQLIYVFFSLHCPLSCSKPRAGLRVPLSSGLRIRASLLPGCFGER